MEFGEEMIGIPQGILKRQGADLLLALCVSVSQFYLSTLTDFETEIAFERKRVSGLHVKKV